VNADQGPLSVERDGRVGVLTMRDEGRRNALGAEMVAQLTDALANLDRDSGIRSVLLRSSGANFCAGGDIRAFDRSVVGGRDYVYDTVNLFRAIEHMRKPVIATVRGYALGGGFELALSCDLIVASDTASFGLPEVSVGAVPAFALVRLAEVAGRAWTKSLAWSARRVTAAEAYQRGVLDRVVPDAELDAESLRLAQDLATLPRVAAEVVKASANRDIADHVLYDSATTAAVMWGTAGIAEGRAAFLERRTPVFPDE
jgi:enoyl-CoA hydratase/carnithine racemase